MSKQLSGELRRELKSIFDSMDKNKRGRITAADLAFLIRSFDELKTDWEVQDLISEIDVGTHSGDGGRVDFEEFVSLMSRSFKTDQTIAAATANAALRKQKNAAQSQAAAAAAGAGGAGGAAGANKQKRKSEQKRPALSFQLPAKMTGFKAGGKLSTTAAGAASGGAASKVPEDAAPAPLAAAAALHRVELRAAYQYLDWDGDGTISASDLQSAFASIGDHYTRLEIEEMMREVSTGQAVAVHPHLTGVVDLTAAAAAVAASAATSETGPLSPATTALATAPPHAITFTEFATALSP